MDDHTRGGSTFADDEVDEFDLLLADDDEADAPPKGRTGLTGRMRAIQPPAPAAGAGVKSRRSGSGPARLRIAPDWSRIAAVLFVAAVVVFIVGFAISSILGARKQGAYEAYFEDVREVMTSSTAQGEELQAILDEPTGGDPAQRVARLEQLAERSDKLVADAKKIEAPEEMVATHAWMLTTLEYRARSVEQLQASVTTALGTPKVTDAAAAAVAAAAARALASDVIWTDSYKTGANRVLDDEGVKSSKVTVPSSSFLGAGGSDIVGPEGAKQMLERLKSSAVIDKKTKQPVVPKDGKKRGGQVESGRVTIAPTGEPLLTTGLTKITGGDDVEFEVPFTNQGDVQLTAVPISILIRGDNSEPIELVGEIDRVDPGETVTGKVALDEVPTFGEILTMTVKVGPVPGEQTAENNIANYEVQFVLQ